MGHATHVAHRVEPGHYETLVEVGRLEGATLLLFTTPHGIDDVEHTRPSASYVTMPASGLLECRHRDAYDVATYSERLGVEGRPA